MPITFTVDHAQRLVVVIATGTVTRETIERYFDTQRMLAGLSYPRLVECRDLDCQLTGDDWGALTGWLQQITARVPFGPAAVIVDNERTLELVDMVSILVRDLCELRAFGDRHSAEEWLSDQLIHSARDRRPTS
jgi:hypothetical protein